VKTYDGVRAVKHQEFIVVIAVPLIVVALLWAVIDHPAGLGEGVQHYRVDSKMRPRLGVINERGQFITCDGHILNIEVGDLIRDPGYCRE